jgi:hypothetical protein
VPSWPEVRLSAGVRTRTDSWVTEHSPGRRHRYRSRRSPGQAPFLPRIGRELEAGPSVSQREIAQVLGGHRSYDELDGEQQAVVRADWGERIEDRVAQLDLAEEFTAQGRSYSELDEHGRVVRHTP